MREGADSEYRLLMPDGRVKWIRDHAFPVRDADGRVFRKAASPPRSPRRSGWRPS